MIDFEPPFTIDGARSEIPYYAARISEFTEAGRRADLTPASSDSEKIAVVLVDYQHDFVDSAGTLYVPGSEADVARFLTWFYASARKITTIYASLDTDRKSVV